ncbi:hypothetical protein BH11BAC4_BH11BAC4_01530 [soil metagenome]
MNDKNQPGSDSSIAVSGAAMNYESDNSIPVCIKALIGKFKKEEKQNPPRSVYQYLYNGKTVFYVPAICCDFFSDLYDNNCKLIGHPDGGFTGRGDGSATDFTSVRTSEKLLWKDERK